MWERKYCLGGFWKLRSHRQSSLFMDVRMVPGGLHHMLGPGLLCCFSCLPGIEHSLPSSPSCRLLYMLFCSLGKPMSGGAVFCCFIFLKGEVSLRKWWSNKTSTGMLKCWSKYKGTWKLKGVRNPCRPWALPSPAATKLHHVMLGLLE